MSEELKKGIPKAVATGTHTNFTQEQCAQHDKILEDILKKIGALEKNQTIKDTNKL